MSTPDFVSPVQPSSAEVYAAFYERYGKADEAGRKVAKRLLPLLNGRVVHRDQSGDRATHLIVHEVAGDNLRTSLYRQDEFGRPYRHYNYDATSFVIAMTDGRSISEWRADRVSGMHPGHVNGIDRPYQASLETLCFDMISPEGDAARLEFNRSSGAGTLAQPGLSLGWLLDAETSRAERARLLPPAA